MISSLTLKTLAIFCNINGIKTKLFKKKNDNKYFPSYYLIPTINRKLEISPKGNKRKKTIKFFLGNKNEKYKTQTNKIKESNNSKDNDKNETFNSMNKYLPRKILKNKITENNNQNNKLNNSNHSFFSFKNSNKMILNCMDENDENTVKNKKLNKSAFYNNKNNSFQICVSNCEEKETSKFINQNITSNIKIKQDILYENNNSNDNNDKDYIPEPVNDEFLPGENFTIKIPDDEGPKNCINNIQKILSDKIYINQLNIIGMDCLKVPLIQQNNSININGLIEKKILVI